MKNSMKITVVALFVVCGSCRSLRAQGGCADSLFAPSLQKHIGRVLKDQPERVLVFLLNFSDFGCELCLNNFLDFCDSLRAIRLGSEDRRVAIFFSRDKNSGSYQATTLRRWAKANNIDVPIHIVGSKLIGADRFDHSAVYLLGSDRHILLCGDIPLSTELKRLILIMLYAGKGGSVGIQ